MRTTGPRLKSEQIVEVQRARILSAMVQVSCERGAADVSVAHVIERSGVSRRTFYETFGDRDDCYLAAFEHVLALARERVIAAVEIEHGWQERVRGGLVALLAFIDEQPQLGRMLVRESLTGSAPRVLERREQVVAEIVAAFDSVRQDSQSPQGATSMTSEATVGAVLAILYSRLSAPEPESTLELANELMSMVVLPYRGRAAARRELSRAVPAIERAAEAPERELPFGRFKANGMRLTYRTVCALLAIAEQPGSSNRVIGESSGMSDQGQISKLLLRLERLGLVANSGGGAGKGLPNAWSLTEHGRRLTESLGVNGEGPRFS